MEECVSVYCTYHDLKRTSRNNLGQKQRACPGELTASSGGSSSGSSVALQSAHEGMMADTTGPCGTTTVHPPQVRYSPRYILHGHPAGLFGIPKYYGEFQLRPFSLATRDVVDTAARMDGKPTAREESCFLDTKEAGGCKTEC